MAQTLLTNITGALVIPNVIGPSPVAQYTHNTPFLNVLEAAGRVIAPGGSAPFGVNISPSGYTAATHAEGDSLASADDTRLFARASASPFYRRVSPSFSGHVLDNVRNNGTYVDIVMDSMADAKLDLRRKIETDLLSNTSEVGLESLVDSTNVCHGLDPSSVTSWVSYENNLSGSLTLSALQDHWATVTNSTYDSTPNIILMTPNQIQNFALASGDGQAATGLIQTRIQLGGGVFDPGVLGMPMQFNGAPILRVMDLTNTTIIMGDLNTLSLKVHRDFQVDEIAKVADGQRFLVSWGGALLISKRKAWSKIVNVSA